jgi:predicted CopG family antitoxin
MVADDVYHELVKLKGESDAVIKKADAALASATGKEHASDLLKQAKAHYAAYDFLDAKRFADAALAAAQ